jgi:hypothetical protein
MGFMKSTKIGSIRTDADRAIKESRTVFLARYWDEVMTYQGTGSVSGAAEAIESVEAAGWRLEHMAYSWVPEKRRGVTLMLFRPTGQARPATDSPLDQPASAETPVNS